MRVEYGSVEKDGSTDLDVDCVIVGLFADKTFAGAGDALDTASGGALKALAERGDLQRRILELFYIRREYGYIQRLCQEFNESERQIYYDKDEALRRYALCRYGLTEL